MTEFLHTEFSALLARTGLSAAEFGAVAGVEQELVMKWSAGWSPAPVWAVRMLILLDHIILDQFKPESSVKKIDFLFEKLNENPLEPHEILGVDLNASVAEIDAAKGVLVEKYSKIQDAVPDLVSSIYQAHDELVISRFDLEIPVQLVALMS